MNKIIDLISLWFYFGEDFCPYCSFHSQILQFTFAFSWNSMVQPLSSPKSLHFVPFSRRTTMNVKLLICEASWYLHPQGFFFFFCIKGKLRLYNFNCSTIKFMVNLNGEYLKLCPIYYFYWSLGFCKSIYSSSFLREILID